MDSVACHSFVSHHLVEEWEPRCKLLVKLLNLKNNFFTSNILTIMKLSEYIWIYSALWYSINSVKRFVPSYLRYNFQMDNRKNCRVTNLRFKIFFNWLKMIDKLDQNSWIFFIIIQFSFIIFRLRWAIN